MLVFMHVILIKFALFLNSDLYVLNLWFNVLIVWNCVCRLKISFEHANLDYDLFNECILDLSTLEHDCYIESVDLLHKLYHHNVISERPFRTQRFEVFPCEG